MFELRRLFYDFCALSDLAFNELLSLRSRWSGVEGVIGSVNAIDEIGNNHLDVDWLAPEMSM